jgi:hypothetical protein
MTDERQYPIPIATDEEVTAFLARYGKPWDPETDEYFRDAFIADICEGKNDPIYNAHSYHTKVPPRAIIPYILHYTDPGDVILDPFCGSGMTGVAAMMCENAPEDIFQSVPGAKKGARRAILNDLSPAACHIAYNYCTSVDVQALNAAFELIKAKVKQEFDWLYGTEHYEPAIGLYDPTKPNVALRLKNPPPNVSEPFLHSTEERIWELLDRAEVERRMGTEALSRQPLAEGVDRFICIPATIQHTVWSDVYKCEGMVSFEEPSGSLNRKTGHPTMKKVRRPRGCGGVFVLWDVAVDHKTGVVSEEFNCPSCGQRWKKVHLKRAKTVPVLTHYRYIGLRQKKQNKSTKIVLAELKKDRPTTEVERELIRTIEEQPIPVWFPTDEINSKGPQYNRNALGARNIQRLADFYTKRNLRALATLWNQARQADPDMAKPLMFVITSAFGRIERMTRYVFKKAGNCSLRGQLYFPSFPVEDNVLRQVQSKLNQIRESFEALSLFNLDYEPLITCCNAGHLSGIPDASVDYVFTDPPFGSNIYYSEVNWIYECWLGRHTDAAAEAVVHRKNDRGTKTIDDYSRLMTEAFRDMYRILKPGRWATVEFNNNDGLVFEAIKQAARSTGFLIENMLFLDKEQKTFKQLKGDKGEEDVVGHDVIFNLRKPATAFAPIKPSLGISETENSHVRSHKNQRLKAAGKNVGELLEHLVAETTREHLRTLPQRIEKDPKTYSDEHRSTPFLNTMLMNVLIPKGVVDVSQINLPYIEQVCGRYFRKVDNRWYLRDETVGNHKPDGNKTDLFQAPEEEVVIEDEMTSIEWLRQKLSKTPMRIGELRPHWMRSTVKLTNDISTRLEQYLREHFWLDRQTRRWREPTEEERALMDTSERQQARHDAERFLAGHLRRHPNDDEILGWIDHLYHSATLIEEEAAGLSDSGEADDLPDEAVRLYAMMPRLFQSVLKEKVSASQYALAQRQCRIATAKASAQTERNRHAEDVAHMEENMPLFKDLPNL